MNTLLNLAGFAMVRVGGEDLATLMWADGSPIPCHTMLVGGSFDFNAGPF